MNAKDTPIDDTPETKSELLAKWVSELHEENASLKLELQKQKDSLFHHYGVVLKQQEEIQRFELERTEMYHKYEKQKELNTELVKSAIDEFIKLDYRSYTLAEIKLVLYPLIKKSNEIC